MNSSKGDFGLHSTNIFNPMLYSKLIIAYIVILSIQVAYIWYELNKKTKQTELDLRIKYDNENSVHVMSVLREKLTERVRLLTSGKMKYEEWLKYNKENTMIDIDGKTYYFFTWERGIHKSGSSLTYTCIGHVNTKYIDLDWENILRDGNDSFVFVKQSIDPKLIPSFFQLGKPGNQLLKYYWVDPKEIVPVQKISIIDVIPENKDHNEIAIGTGMDIHNLNNYNTIHYITRIHRSYSVLISLLTLIISIIIYIFSTPNDRYKSYLFLIISNAYLLYFWNDIEYRGTNETEIKKIDEINSGMLGVSFLVGINTYILTHLTKNDHKDLFIQSALIFSISLITLLVASFKVTDAITADDLIQDRLSHQMTFNFSVLLNVLVVSNYLYSVLKKQMFS